LDALMKRQVWKTASNVSKITMIFAFDAGTERPRMIKGTFSGAFLIPVRRGP
jgi:hypothetical protein